MTLGTNQILTLDIHIHLADIDAIKATTFPQYHFEMVYNRK